MALVWNDHLSAQVTLVGMSLDLIGGLYLAYDLLGGDKGPLSTLTRCVTYSVIVIACVGFSMGLKFGLLAGAGLGIALGLHLERIGRGQKETTAFLFALGLVRATAAPAGVRPEDVMATLEKLGDLKAKGILTEEEFAAKKAELLKKLV